MANITQFVFAHTITPSWECSKSSTSSVFQHRKSYHLLEISQGCWWWFAECSPNSSNLMSCIIDERNKFEKFTDIDNAVWVCVHGPKLLGLVLFIPWSWCTLISPTDTSIEQGCQESRCVETTVTSRGQQCQENRRFKSVVNIVSNRLAHKTVSKPLPDVSQNEEVVWTRQDRKECIQGESIDSTRCQTRG